MTFADASRPSVAIIGAGWAGLACALKLAKAGLTPVIFESAPEAGGRARRAKFDYVYRDNGQHLMLSGCQALIELFTQIGVNLPRTPFSYTDGERGLYLSNTRGAAGLLLALIQAPGFSWAARFALIRAIVRLKRQGWRVPHTQTVAQWLEAQHQPTVLITHFWAPLALAILNTPLEQAAMMRLAAVLSDTLGKGTDALGIMQPSADLSTSIVTPLLNHITMAGGQIHLRTRIRAVSEPSASGFTLTLDDATSAHNFAAVVLAVPSWALTHMALPFDATPFASQFGAQPIATVYLGFDAEVHLPTPLVLLDGPTQTDACVWAMDRAHCGEPGVIAVSLSANGPWATLDHPTLAQQCLDNLQAVLGVPLNCRWRQVVTVHRATPSVTPSAYLSPTLRQPLPGLHLAGDWTHPTYPATLEAAVQTGFMAADQVLSGFA